MVDGLGDRVLPESPIMKRVKEAHAEARAPASGLDHSADDIAGDVT
jgi:hypothetical protein